MSEDISRANSCQKCLIRDVRAFSSPFPSDESEVQEKISQQIAGVREELITQGEQSEAQPSSVISGPAHLFWGAPERLVTSGHNNSDPEAYARCMPHAQAVMEFCPLALGNRDDTEPLLLPTSDTAQNATENLCRVNPEFEDEKDFDHESTNESSEIPSGDNMLHQRKTPQYTSSNTEESLSIRSTSVDSDEMLPTHSDSKPGIPELEDAICNVCSQKCDDSKASRALSCGHILCSTCAISNFSKDYSCLKCLMQELYVSFFSFISSTQKNPEKSSGTMREKLKYLGKSLEKPSEKLDDLSDNSKLSSETSETSDLHIGNSKTTLTLDHDLVFPQGYSTGLQDQQVFPICPLILGARDVKFPEDATVGNLHNVIAQEIDEEDLERGSFENLAAAASSEDIKGDSAEALQYLSSGRDDSPSFGSCLCDGKVIDTNDIPGDWSKTCEQKLMKNSNDESNLFMRAKETEDTNSEVCPKNCDDESYPERKIRSENQAQKPFALSSSFNFCFSECPQKTQRQVAGIRERFDIHEGQPEAELSSATPDKQNLSLGSEGTPAIFRHDNKRPLSQPAFQVHQPVSGTRDEEQPSAFTTPEEDNRGIIDGVEPRVICCEKVLKQMSVDISTDTSLDSVDSGVFVDSESNDSGKPPECDSCATLCDKLNPALSDSKTVSERDFEEAWRDDKDLNQINIKINDLKAIQTQMAELSQGTDISSHKKIFPSLNGTDYALEEDEKLQEVSDMLVLLEDLKWKLQFTKISSVISATKKEVDLIYSSVIHHSEYELEKAIKNRPGVADSSHRGLPANPLTRNPRDNQPTRSTKPATSQESMTSEGIPFNIPKRHNCITVKDKHDKVSLEELRLEHYYYLSCAESRPGVRSGSSPPGGRWLGVPTSRPEPPEILPPGNLVLTDVGMRDSTGQSQLLPRRESDDATAAKYTATLDIDIVTGDFVILPIKTRLHAITAMEEYRHKSTEELRVEHYLLSVAADAPQRESDSSQGAGRSLVTQKKLKRGAKQ
ncbi:uncharacterized protein LOC135202696 [Macrobrachium nipponense]|uniref:uncharacterized protein LOC135202696 n=1 Tax=Macrobrachium nipponense TaxID=159736 RepID=UPI0030C802AE